MRSPDGLGARPNSRAKSLSVGLLIDDRHWRRAVELRPDRVRLRRENEAMRPTVALCVDEDGSSCRTFPAGQGAGTAGFGAYWRVEMLAVAEFGDLGQQFGGATAPTSTMPIFSASCFSRRKATGSSGGSIALEFGKFWLTSWKPMLDSLSTRWISRSQRSPADSKVRLKSSRVLPILPRDQQARNGRRRECAVRVSTRASCRLPDCAVPQARPARTPAARIVQRGAAPV